MSQFGTPIMRLGGLKRPPAPRPPQTVLPGATPAVSPAVTSTPAPAAAAPAAPSGGLGDLKLVGGKLDFNSIIKAYQGQQDKANAANESRYTGILDTLKGQGASSKTDIARSGGEERAGIRQDAIDRGLFNTSVLNSMENQSYDSERRQNQAVDESVADRTAGVMERRTDQGPDAGMFGQLLSQAAAGIGAPQGQSAGSSGGMANSFAGVDPTRFSGSGGGRGGGNDTSSGWSNIFGGGGGNSSGNSGVQTFTNDAARQQGAAGPAGGPSTTPAFNPNMQPVTGNSRPNSDSAIYTPSDVEYWVRRGYDQTGARNMAQRYQ